MFEVGWLRRGTFEVHALDPDFKQRKSYGMHVVYEGASTLCVELMLSRLSSPVHEPSLYRRYSIRHGL